MLYYAGIGSRKTPQSILMQMTDLAFQLEKLDFILRSGGAQGADQAFEAGVINRANKQIFYANDARGDIKAANIAAKYHPRWDLCTEYPRLLHARNAYQVLGKDLKSPSIFIVCWTPDGVKTHEQRTITTGGTGTAISIASGAGIKVFNLCSDTVEDVLTYAKRCIGGIS